MLPIRLPRHTFAAAMVSFVATTATLLADTLQVDVLDVVILPETRLVGIKVSEISGIAWDADAGVLWAVTDKARLIRFQLSIDGDRIATFQAETAIALTDTAGTKIDNDFFNPEGMAIINGSDGDPANAEFAIVSELGPAIARFSTSGKWLADFEVPAPLRDPARQKSEGDGLEALTLHPVHGLVTLPEEPLLDAPRRIHTLFAGDGTSYQFSTEAVGNTSVKALETLSNGRILLLDRMRSEDKLRLLPFLSIIDLAACKPDAPCPVVTAPVMVPGVTDADFEGITEVSPGRFLMISDDEINGDKRTVIALVALGEV